MFGALAFIAFGSGEVQSWAKEESVDTIDVQMEIPESDSVKITNEKVTCYFDHAHNKD